MYRVLVDGRGSKNVTEFRADRVQYVANGNAVRLFHPEKQTSSDFDDENLGEAVDFPLGRVQRVETR
jgi:hypothetical protein